MVDLGVVTIAFIHELNVFEVFQCFVRNIEPVQSECRAGILAGKAVDFMNLLLIFQLRNLELYLHVAVFIDR